MPLNDMQKTEIEDLRKNLNQTYRPTAPGLENILGIVIPVLDHGFLRVVDYMGDDAAVIQAARVSYGRGTKRTATDEGLIRYLMRHSHSTPFEMCSIKLHVKLPIFVARQWIRHRTGSFNEISARYSILEKEFYVPKPEHLSAQAVENRQGRGEVLQGQEASDVLNMLRSDAMGGYDHYRQMLNQDEDGTIIDLSRQGLARELARMSLTLGTYTQWYWKTNLHNLMNFLNLRADSHAQYEIRAYAEPMLDMLKAWVPLIHQAFLDYRLGAVKFSAPMMRVLVRMLAGEEVTQENSGLGVREWKDMQASLARSRLPS